MTTAATAATNYEAMRFWAYIAFGLLNLLGTIGVGIYAWIISQGKDSARHIKALEEVMLKKISEAVNRLDSQSSRLDKVETHMTYLPSPEQLHKLALEVSHIGAVQREQHAANTHQLRTMGTAIERIEDYLLGQKR